MDSDIELLRSDMKEITEQINKLTIQNEKHVMRLAQLRSEIGKMTAVIKDILYASRQTIASEKVRNDAQ